MIASGLPRYYTELRPFRDLLASGDAILTYHHVGLRPPGARLKGLYVDSELFSRQLAELHNAGFKAEAFDRLTSPVPIGRGRIFISFDDGFQDVFENAPAVLNEHRFTSMQFLVANCLGQTSIWQAPSGEIPGKLMDREAVREWLAAGHQIGSHTLTHPFLSRIPIEQAKEEIIGSKKKLEDLFGLETAHFCYPYGDCNAAVRDLVKEAGYRTACTTQFGVNRRDTDRYSLRRLTARYRSRNLRGLGRWITGLLQRDNSETNSDC